MIFLPAIDLHRGKCVRLFQGDYQTAQVVADDPFSTARRFRESGARWMHLVDLDGAKEGVPKNAELILKVAAESGLRVEVGGGVRNMETVDAYLENGVSRVILGSSALEDPEFVQKALKRYGRKIAVGIDASHGMVMTRGWLTESRVDYIELGKRMEQMGVETLIYTDISRDGAMSGPNLDQLDRLNRAVSCNIIASGGVSGIDDVRAVRDLGLYGVIAGKSLYNGALDPEEAAIACQKLGLPKTLHAWEDELERYFEKSPLLPAIVQEEGTGEVLMLAYMNRDSLRKTLETGETWFYSRSRNTLWHKGETSGHVQKVTEISADCDDDTLLVQVRQTGAACHTGRHSCFFKVVK